MKKSLLISLPEATHIIHLWFLYSPMTPCQINQFLSFTSDLHNHSALKVFDCQISSPPTHLTLPWRQLHLPEKGTAVGSFKETVRSVLKRLFLCKSPTFSCPDCLHRAGICPAIGDLRVHPSCHLKDLDCNIWMNEQDKTPWPPMYACP